VIPYDRQEAHREEGPRIRQLLRRTLGGAILVVGICIAQWHGQSVLGHTFGTARPVGRIFRKSVFLDCGGAQ